MLSPEQTADFHSTGITMVSQAVPGDRVAAMSDAVWAFLADRHHRFRQRPETWSPFTDSPGLQALTRAGAFDALGAHLTPLVDDLLGTDRWKVPRHWGHPLITFPGPGAWSLPVGGWHVDSHQWSRGAVPGLVAFTFLEQVRPHGGGTLVVSGSHHLTWQLCRRAGGFVRTSELKSELAREHSWFAHLWSAVTPDSDRISQHLDSAALIDGVNVSMVELCGDPGDVVLMNSRCLHAPAPNVGVSPRLMLSDFLDRADTPHHGTTDPEAAGMTPAAPDR